ncbi:endonuclease/exonuclease/phosphatase family protein, partial [Schlesneria sp.]|uniref:endonuclease/exonuclease/phosphatase family protein n=1 Tax=Schlesneria sp. TaxID=2762018 RepID=UPI002F24B877
MKALLLALIVLTTMVQTSFAQTVTVMSWNIRLNTPRDGVNAWPNRKDWLARIVADNQTDIAGFQEVLAGQLEDLKERLKDMDAYGVGRDDGKAAGEFSPIFYRRDRFELQEKSTF